MYDSKKRRERYLINKEKDKKANLKRYYNNINEYRKIKKKYYEKNKEIIQKKARDNMNRLRAKRRVSQNETV